MPYRLGDKLGHYEVREYLGQGDYGATYHGWDRNLSQEVSILVLEFVSGGPALGEFREMARRLVRLNHPNAQGVLQAGEHEGVPYLVLPPFHGSTLAERRDRGLIGPDAAVRLLRGVGAAVDQAHALEIVHGDLQPARVLIDDNEHPQVAYFGLAPLRAAVGGGGAPDPLYAAPELISSGQFTAAGDRYSFSTIAYTVLTGVAPFESLSPEERANAQLGALPPAPSSRNHWLDESVDSVLLRGLAKDPTARWGSCGQMVEALEAALARRPQPPPPFPPPIPPAQPARAAPRRSRWPWVLIGLAAAVLVGFLIWYLTQSNSPSLSLSQASATAGQQITLRGSHIPANQVGSIQLQSDPVQIGTFQADGSGNVLATATIPKDTSQGTHVVSLCWNGSCPASSQLTVLPGPSPTPSPSPTPTLPPSPTPTHPPSPSPTPTPTPTPTRTPTAPPTASP
jgi:serine/threonine protein kinase